MFFPGLEARLDLLIENGGSNDDDAQQLMAWLGWNPELLTLAVNLIL